MAAGAGIEEEVSAYAHGRVPRAVRQRQVLAAASELFAEHGFTGASMDELARRVGVSKPVVYDLVGSKEELYRRCVERLGDALAARITTAAASADTPAAQVEACALAFFRFVREHRRVWDALAWNPGPFADDVAAVRRGQDELVAHLFREEAERRGLRPDTARVGAVAQAVNGAVEALARWWRDHGEVPPEDLARWVVELLMPGLEAQLAR